MESKPLEELNKTESKASIMSRMFAACVPVDSDKKRQRLIDAMEFRRDQYGLRPTEFASVLGMGGAHYYEFLNGKRGLSINATKRAAAIGVPKEALLDIVEYK